MSETKRYGSVEVLCEKILHEAEDYKNELLEKTSSEAKGISEEYEKKAQAAKDEILSHAEEKAAEARRTAESAEETRARNARLSVKSELLAAAYRRAEEKIALLPKEEAIALFLPYLKEALEQKPAGQARLVVGEKSPFGADELCALCAEVLADDPLFVLFNSYTTGLSASTVGYLMELHFGKRFGGIVTADEVGIPVTQTGGILPAGAASRAYGAAARSIAAKLNSDGRAYGECCREI